MTEHNPATLRYDEHDEDHHRIEHIAHELSDENRQKAGNVSLHVRDYIGWLWREIDEFVRLPALPAGSWHGRRDRLEGLFERFCAMCAGAGLAGRIMRHHPSDEWKLYTDGGVRFSASSSLHAIWIPGPMATPESVTANIKNFSHAKDFFGSGVPDEDYPAPRTTVEPEAVAITLPAPRTTNRLFDAAVMGTWRLRYDAVKAWAATQPRNSYHVGIFRKLAVAQLLYLLHPRTDVSDPDDRQPLLDNIATVTTDLFFARDWAFSQLLSGVQPWLGMWPNFQGMVIVRKLDQIRAVRFEGFGGFLTQASDTAAQTDPTAAWDPAKREAVFDIVDAVLGDRTPARPEAPNG